MSQDKKYTVSWDLLQMHARTLSQRLLPNTRWKGIIAVARGGLVPAALLARELGIRYIDTVCISSYDHDRQRNQHILKHAPIDGDDFLIVDDLVDTGSTAKTIRRLYPKAYFVAIFAKPEGKPFVDDYVEDVAQDTWIEQPWDMALNYQTPLCEL